MNHEATVGPGDGQDEIPSGGELVDDLAHVAVLEHPGAGLAHDHDLEAAHDARWPGVEDGAETIGAFIARERIGLSEPDALPDTAALRSGFVGFAAFGRRVLQVRTSDASSFADAAIRHDYVINPHGGAAFAALAARAHFGERQTALLLRALGGLFAVHVFCWERSLGFRLAERRPPEA